HAAGGVPSHTQTGLHHFPTAHLHKHGHIVHLEISVNVLHDNGEKVLVGFARDVTERMHAEQELARLTRQQRLILDSAGEGIAGFDREGKITFINPAAAATFGGRDRQLIGCSAHEVLLHSTATPGDCAMPDCPICPVLKEGRRSTHTAGEFAHADGTRFPVEYSITAMHAGHEVIGAVLTFRDITERRAAERERQELQAQIEASRRLESLGLLAGGIAHDLNNMLAGIQGNADLALSDLPPGSPISARIGRIVAVCERASKVVDQILTAAGRKTRDMVSLNLTDITRDTVELMRATIPERIKLDPRLAETPPVIEGDGGQLQQVITNLLVNAVEAIENGSGQITVTTETRRLETGEISHAFPGHELMPGQYACVTVADTGCGMSEETRARIFEPFFSTKGHGRGLGLSALHGVVGAHRGGVQVQSAPGAGTRFTVVFPAGHAPPPPRQRPAQKPRDRIDEATVLVIDDDDDVRSVIHDVLVGSGFHVLTAENGTRGIEVFRQNTNAVDVVLLDTIMPDLSGREVYQELVEMQPDVKVIVISGYSEELSLSRFGDRKPLAFVHKPFMNNELVQTISSALGD
ncbi:MAG: PAS domain S-box protein, partial [Phycisphaerae bacterium]|nr:PAS domain S-box protein [Phycisphaerae bacterium]